jgi:hypothetical protein
MGCLDEFWMEVSETANRRKSDEDVDMNGGNAPQMPRQEFSPSRCSTAGSFPPAREELKLRTWILGW